MLILSDKDRLKDKPFSPKHHSVILEVVRDAPPYERRDWVYMGGACRTVVFVWQKQTLCFWPIKEGWKL